MKKARRGWKPAMNDAGWPSEHCKVSADGKTFMCEYPKGTATFKLGERVEYDVYPYGTDIPAVITKNGPKAIGFAAGCFKSQKVSESCNWDSTDDIRKVKITDPLRRRKRKK